jgi:hypothetical protein
MKGKRVILLTGWPLLALLLGFGDAISADSSFPGIEFYRMDSSLLRGVPGKAAGFDKAVLLDVSGNHASVSPSRPSKAKSFFLSLAVPGLGELYSGSRSMAVVFIGTEASLWAGYFSCRTYGDWKKQDYRLFAAAHAGVDPARKEYQYFVNIENYAGIVEYNDAKLRQRLPDKMYPENSRYFWKWDSESSRKKFEKLRLQSDRANNLSLILVGGIVVNHVVSGIDAIRAAKKKESLNVQAGLSRQGNGAILTIVKRF